MSNFHLYAETLSSAGVGTPLWEPISSPNHRAPTFGDVGYLRFGAFIRLFNAMLPLGHVENENGVPTHHVPFTVHTKIVHSVIPAGVVATSGVQTTGVSRTESDTTVHFRCTAKSGAVAMSSSELRRQDIASQSLQAFADYMAAHIHEWANFARFQLMHEVASHELIFVTGCDITEGKYSVTVFNDARVSKRTDASFQLSLFASSSYRTSHSPAIGYFQHNHGSRSRTRPTEKCMFVRGFKVLNRQIEQSESEDELESCFHDNCAVNQPRGPLDAMLRYLIDKSDAEIAIVHDYDLARLIQKHDVPCDYRALVKQLKKSRRPILRRGNAVFLS